MKHALMGDTSSVKSRTGHRTRQLSSADDNSTVCPDPVRYIPTAPQIHPFISQPAIGGLHLRLDVGLDLLRLAATATAPCCTFTARSRCHHYRGLLRRSHRGRCSGGGFWVPADHANVYVPEYRGLGNIHLSLPVEY